MVRVPTYEQNVSLRPALRSDMNVRATPEAFGAAVGRGMQDLGRGVGQVSEAFARVQDLEDTAAAKDAENAYAEWALQREYGQGGYMTMEGRNAVDAYKGFLEEAEAKRKEFGGGLSPGAARKYQEASQARLLSIQRQALVHRANQTKRWIKQASDARIKTFADDAMANYDKPAVMHRALGAGIMEIRDRAALEGWSDDARKMAEREFVSGAQKGVVQRLMAEDPVSADAYLKANGAAILEDDRFALQQKLDPLVKNEWSKTHAEEFLTRRRGGDGQRSLKTVEKDLARSVAPEIEDPQQQTFAANLRAFAEDVPPEFRDKFTMSYIEDTGRVELHWDGEDFAQAPAGLHEWIRDNAVSYGLGVPEGGDADASSPEPAQATIVPRSNAVSARSLLPSHDEIEAYLETIDDPDVRDLTRQRITAAMAARSKAQEEISKAAKAEVYAFMDRGVTVDEIDPELISTSGIKLAELWDYQKKIASGADAANDEVLLYDMRRLAAQDPDQFSRIDLNDYRGRLSRAAITELTGLQTRAMGDIHQARQTGSVVDAAFRQAQMQLEAVGVTTTGLTGDKRKDAAQRIARFQNAIAAEIDTFQRDNNGRLPDYGETQGIINRLLLPVVMRAPDEGPSFGTFLISPAVAAYQALFGGGETEGFAFEARYRPDGSNIETGVEYEEIPTDLRAVIASDLETQLGRKPSEAEIAQQYGRFVLNNQ